MQKEFDDLCARIGRIYQETAPKMERNIKKSSLLITFSYTHLIQKNEKNI